jgi:hydroxypyruvate isomerase
MNRRTFATSLAAAAVSITSMKPRQLFGANKAETNKPQGGKTYDLPIKLSVMLWTILRDLPFEQRLQKVAEAGYSNVELVGEYAHWKPEEFDRTNAARKRLGITFDVTAGVKHGVCNPSEREAMLTDLRETLIAMEKLECPSVILMSGNIVPGLSREAQHESCIEGLRAAAKVMEGRKIAGAPVRLLLETIDPEENPKYFLMSAAEALEIIKAVDNPQVQFLYDFFHEQIAEGNLIEKLEKNMEQVAVVHVADVPGRHEPGTGEINYQNIFRKLGELKYRGTIAMEFLPKGDPVKQLALAREMAERCYREGWRG